MTRHRSPRSTRLRREEPPPVPQGLVNLNRLSRQIHYWATAFVALPVLLIIGSGILLQMKKQWSWVQPQEQRGTGQIPGVSLVEVLESVQSQTPHGVRGWQDVNRIDIRPGRGVAKVWLRNGFEVQIDLGTGAVLHDAYRRSDWIESLHDGSLFGGDIGRFSVFLPAAIVLFVMWLTGLWMFWWPFWVKRKRSRSAT